MTSTAGATGLGSEHHWFHCQPCLPQPVGKLPNDLLTASAGRHCEEPGGPEEPGFGSVRKTEEATTAGGKISMYSQRTTVRSKAARARHGDLLLSLTGRRAH